MCKEVSTIPSKNVIPPQKLTVAEIADPYRVIYELFDFAHLPRIRELLWEFFKTTVIGNYSHDLHRRDRELLVTIYEKIEKLVEAAHIINESQKQSKKPVFETYPFSSDNIDSFKLKRLTEAFKVDGYLHENLTAVVEAILRITNAEKVFWSGFTITSRKRPQFDFIVLLPSNTKYSYSDYLTQVQAKCSEIGSIMIWCNKINEVYKHLRNGHIFYSAVCSAELMVYDNKRVTLPDKPNIDLTTMKVNARNNFDNSFLIAKSFLDGAEYYATTGQHRPAAFLLHQATEHALRALLIALTGLTAYGHNVI